MEMDDTGDTGQDDRDFYDAMESGEINNVVDDLNLPASRIQVVEGRSIDYEVKQQT